MAKVADVATVVISFGEEVGEAMAVRQSLKATYLDNGWDLFETHYMGIAEHKVMMTYVFVLYEKEPVVASEGDVAPRKRGRPAKVVQEELPLEV